MHEVIALVKLYICSMFNGKVKFYMILDMKLSHAFKEKMKQFSILLACH